MVDDYKEEMDALRKEDLEIARERKNNLIKLTRLENALELYYSNAYSDLKGDRKTLSAETGFVEFLGTCEKKIKGINVYKNHLKAVIKGDEGIIKGLETNIMAIQSVWKYDQTGEWGKHE